MVNITGTGNIRQTFRQNSNLTTRGLNVGEINSNPLLNTALYYLILGSGPQQNRVISYYKRNGYNFSFVKNIR